MAASMLRRRTAVWCRTLTGAPSLKLALQTASYNPRPLRLELRRPYVPDKDAEKTPGWQKTARYDGKLFGRLGSASGIDPASLWPARERLDRLVAEENEWHPPLEAMLKSVAAEEAAEAEKRLAREKLIAANMAKMPKMIADWRREKREAKQKLKEEKARRAKLLAEARERFGYAMDPRNQKFLEMVAEIEKEEKKKKKLLKKRLSQEAASVTPPAASS